MNLHKISLSDHFNYKRLFRFTLPSIVSMLLLQIYGVIDGLFVSNFVGKEQFVGLNLIWPAILILGAIGSMIGVGGSALIGKILGEGNNKKANEIFSFFTYFMIVLGIIMAILGNVFLPQIAKLLGAKDVILDYAIIYGRVCFSGVIFLTLQYAFQNFLIAAEKPKVGLYITIVCGFINISLDALFIIVFKWGLTGAAFATILSQSIGSIIPIILFLRKKNNWILKLGRAKLEIKALFKATMNGSSEFVSNISGAIIGILFNYQLLKYAGNDGVAAYGTLMYVSMIFIALFFGFTTGVSPLFSYQYGANNSAELKNLFKKSSVIIFIFSLSMFILAEALSYPISYIFVGYDKALLDMTLHAFKIFSISFLFCGIGIFGSALFTSLNNGLVSAALSLFRTLILQVLFVFLLPLFWGLDGIWWSVIFAESVAAFTSIIFMIIYKKKYKYL